MDLSDFRKFKEENPLSRIGWGIAGWVIFAIIALGVVLTAVYTVPADSEGVIVRFGKYIKTVQPGLGIKLPLGIDTIHKVPTRRQLKQEFGFGTLGATNPTQYAKKNVMQEEKMMVSGDLNAALVEWVIQYKIKDPQQYLFNVRNPGDTLRDASESVMREVVGDRTVDEVITIGRQEIESVALKKLQELVNKYEMGLSIDQVQLKNVNPPKEVQASFNEVNQAQQEMKKEINVARGAYNKAVPKARGTADKTISEAEGYATKRVNEAEGDVAGFKAVLAEYVKAPEITRQRLYLETMAEVVPQLGRKVIIDDETSQLLPLLQLDAGERRVGK